MTYKGQLMSIDRHGINRGDIGPLAKSSFEETTDMLINASIFAEYDNVNGVSANVMLGQQAPCGTGDSNVLLDEEHLIELMKEIKDIKTQDYEDDDIGIQFEDNICTSNDLEFNYNIKNNSNNCVIFKDTKIIIKN